MNEWIVGLALALLLTLIAGLIRVWRGPTVADRMLAAQLLGTTGAAILLLLAEGTGAPALRDVALVQSVLAATATIVFVRRWPLSTDGTGSDADAR